MTDQILQCGYVYRPVVFDGDVKIDSTFESHMNRISKSDDFLAPNYTLEYTYRTMQEYGYVYDGDPSNLVMMVGLQKIGDEIYRSGSRTYVDPKYRTKYFRSPDNLEVSALQINRYIEGARMIFESRQYSTPGLFKHFIRNTDLFKDWKIYPKKVEILYPYNYQWIMYTGELLLDEIAP